MGEVCTTLTVLFEEPFWVGVFERSENGRLSVAKVTFGAEPKDKEVLEFVLKHYFSLKFSPTVAAVHRQTALNPKRMQRQVNRVLHSSGIGTASQEAMKLLMQQNKLQRKAVSHERKLEQEQRMFDLKQQKKKEKHKGR